MNEDPEPTICPICGISYIWLHLVCHKPEETESKPATTKTLTEIREIRKRLREGNKEK